MRKFQCLLFVLKRSYTGYYIICMTVPSTKKSPERFHDVILMSLLLTLNIFSHLVSALVTLVRLSVITRVKNKGL